MACHQVEDNALGVPVCICSLIADSLFKLFPVVVVKMLSKRQPDSPNSPDLSTLLRHYEFKLLETKLGGFTLTSASAFVGVG